MATIEAISPPIFQEFATGSRLVVQYVVKNVSVGTEWLAIDEALAAKTKGGTISIPAMGQLAPPGGRFDGLLVTGRRVFRDQGLYTVEVTYENKANADPAMLSVDDIIDFSRSVIGDTKSVFYDRAGDRMEVKYFDGTTLSEQWTETDILKSSHSITIRIIKASRITQAEFDTYLDHVNSAVWNSYPINSIRLEGMGDQPIQGGTNWVWDLDLLYDPDRHRAEKVFFNGAFLPPNADTGDPTAGGIGGIALFDPYPEVSFAGLGVDFANIVI